MLLVKINNINDVQRKFSAVLEIEVSLTIIYYSLSLQHRSMKNRNLFTTYIFVSAGISNVDANYKTF